MCRIAGIYDPAAAAAETAHTVKQMCDLLRHGGPDDEGIFTAGNLVLGNRRLALMDLSQAGHQPMQYTERYTITYNGELYNFKTLKQELMLLGKTFSTGTDTEVILAAFAQWNTQSFAKLNGMFAFALWDNSDQALYLVRDAAGIKPLYYSTASGKLAFASEMRAFAPVAHLQQPYKNAAVYLLAYGHIPEPVTTLQDVHPLPKGFFLKYNVASGTHSLQSFTHFSYSNRIVNEDEATAIIRSAVTDAVKRQMTADAPLGIFLSGGIDSSVLTLLADKEKTTGLNTLSVYFEEEKYSEKEYQDAVAAKTNVQHHAFLIKKADFEDAFTKIKAAMDMPSSDGINSWFISKYAKELGLKAVLSGIGGDELFGGYPSFGRMKAALRLQKLPDAAFTAAAAVLSKRKLQRAAYLRIEGIKGIYLFLRGIFTPAEIAQQLGATKKEVWEILNALPATNDISSLSPGNTAGWMEFNMYMQNQPLRDADTMSMAHSLELRVPFLDNEVIRPVFSMDEKIKYRGPVPKQALIHAFSDLLPEKVWNRKKMGFSFPFAEWMKESETIKALVAGSNKHTVQTVKAFTEGRVHWSLVMALIAGQKIGLHS